VQTLKGRTPDAMIRNEHNVPRGSSAAMPEIDAGLHAGTPIGDALLALLEAQPAHALGVRFNTDILRRTRTMRTPGGQVELAFDVGRMRAAGRAINVLELEIEATGGSPQAVLAAARRWVPRHGLWLDTRSKAERGDLLAGGETKAAPTRAASVELEPEMSGHAAWQRVLGSCADQIIGNASQIASGEHLPEHVHQLRVGLRRLRSALRLFEEEGADATLGEPAAALFRRLGSARDAAVIESEFGAELIAALHAEGMAKDAELLPASGVPELPAAVLREPAAQLFLLDLLAASQLPSPVDPEPGAPLRDRLARRLNRWHRQVLQDVGRFTELDDAGLHRLRKRAKRLRYGAEFAGSLFERRALRRFLRAMDALQDRLGAITDTLMATRAFREAADTHGYRAFALGWLAARRAALIHGAARELKAFRKVERFWKA
jgi:CHAD domain-containing protein